MAINQLSSLMGRRFNPDYEAGIDARVPFLSAMYAARDADALAKKKQALQEQQLAQEAELGQQQLDIQSQYLGLDQATIDQFMQQARDQQDNSMMNLGLKGGMGALEHGGRAFNLMKSIFDPGAEVPTAGTAWLPDLDSTYPGLKEGIVNAVQDSEGASGGADYLKNIFSPGQVATGAKAGVVPDGFMGLEVKPQVSFFDPGAVDAFGSSPTQDINMLGLVVDPSQAAGQGAGDVQAFLSAGAGDTAEMSMLGLNTGAVESAVSSGQSGGLAGVNLGLDVGDDSAGGLVTASGFDSGGVWGGGLGNSSMQNLGLGTKGAIDIGTPSAGELAREVAGVANAEAAGGGLLGNLGSAAAGAAGGYLGNLLGESLTGDPKGGVALGGITGSGATLAYQIATMGLAGASPISMLGLAAFPVMTLMESIFGSDDDSLSDYRAAQNAANTEAKKAASGTAKYGYAAGTEGLPEGGERWIALNNDYGQGVSDESGRMRIEPYFAGSQADQPTYRYGNIGLEKTAAGPAPEGPAKYVSWYLFDSPQQGLGAATTFAPYSESWGPYSDGRSGSTQMYTNTGSTTYDDWKAQQDAAAAKTAAAPALDLSTLGLSATSAATSPVSSILSVPLSQSGALTVGSGMAGLPELFNKRRKTSLAGEDPTGRPSNTLKTTW